MGHSPDRGGCGLPLQGRRVGSCDARFRGLLGVHISYGPNRSLNRLNDPLSFKASTRLLPPESLELLPARMNQVAGWDSHPLKTNTFARRTPCKGERDREHPQLLSPLRS